MDAKRTQTRLRRLILESTEIKIGVYCIRKSGIALLKDALRRFLLDGGSLTILFGTHTTVDALDELCEIEKSRRIRFGLYDEAVFHSKIYIFKLKEGSTTSIVGSSNLTESALSTNIEINLEIRDYSKLEAEYDGFFRQSERNRREIIKRLKKFEKINKGIDKSESNLNRAAREASEGKKATWLYLELNRQLEYIADINLRNRLKSTWLAAERRIAQEPKEKRTKNGKKAWLRTRLYFLTKRVILNSERNLNRSQKTMLFVAVAKYSLMDSEIGMNDFATKKFLINLMTIVKKRKLEKTFLRALWSKRKYGRRLFKKIADEINRQKS